MKVERVYTRKVLATTRSASIVEAAAAMRRYRVGALLVMEDGAPGTGAPVGIITDRDLALEGFASETLTVGAAMTPVVATVREDADVHEALETMRAHGVRRLIVTDGHAAVRGILSVDDIVDGLSADLAAAAAVLRGEIRRDSAGLGDVKVGG
ncbi:MAG: CBS domain-containing protein [Usitatibacter sp.]